MRLKDKEDLLMLTLDVTLFHPLLGVGRILEIRRESIRLELPNGIKVFGTSGARGSDSFIDELFTEPVIIVEQSKEK